MVPLYAARIEDLGPGDFVRVECGACGDDALIPPSALLQGLRLAPATLVLDLGTRLRCRKCDTRGKAVVSVRWGGASGCDWAWGPADPGWRVMLLDRAGNTQPTLASMGLWKEILSVERPLFRCFRACGELLPYAS
jgi:hypothetical protein